MERALASMRASVRACAGSGALDAVSDGENAAERNFGDGETGTATGDLRGRTYVVTGTETSAIAAACARRLRDAGARVVCACVDANEARARVDGDKGDGRDEDATTANTAHERELRASGALVTMYCDVERLETIERFAREFCAKAWALDGVLNAASTTMEEFSLTADGIERHFAVNHLAHFKLTSLLMDELVRTAAASGREGRVVYLTSNLHHFSFRIRQGTPKPSRGIDFANINSDFGYSPLNAYGQSKLANVLHAWSLSERLAKSGARVRCVAATPGLTELELDRSLSFPGGSLISAPLKYVMINTLEEAVVTPLYCLTAPTIPPGTYFNNCVPVKASLPGRDPRLAARLWEFSEELCDAGAVKDAEGSD